MKYAVCWRNILILQKAKDMCLREHLLLFLYKLADKMASKIVLFTPLCLAPSVIFLMQFDQQTI